VEALGLDASIPIRPSRGGGWGTVIFLPVSSRQDRTATGFDVRARKARRQPGLCCLAVAVIAAGVTRRCIELVGTGNQSATVSG